MSMKQFLAVLLLIASFTVQAESKHTIHHVVIIWLKQHGDQAVRQQYIDASQFLAELPGVLAYELGVPAEIKRSRVNPALDESYDIAIHSQFESAEAFSAFMADPNYLKLAQETLKPLVDHYQMYDFTD